MINNLSFNLTKPIFGRSNKLLKGSENMYLSCFCILYQLSATLIISGSNYCIVIIWFGQVETENKPSKSVKMSHFGVVFSNFFWLRGATPLGLPLNIQRSAPRCTWVKFNTLNTIWLSSIYLQRTHCRSHWPFDYSSIKYFCYVMNLFEMCFLYSMEIKNEWMNVTVWSIFNMDSISN